MSISTPGGDQRRPTVITGKKAVVGGKPKSDADSTEPAESATDAKAAKPAPAARQGKTTPDAKGAGGGSGKRPGGARPTGGGKGRKPVAPVKVSQGRAWGPIALFTTAGVLAVAIVGFGAWSVYQNGRSWQDKADDIPGIADIRKTDRSSLDYQKHQSGPIKYTKYSPPVGGVHNDAWQNCMGDVYDAPIANEHAVHSLEHGAVWITYRPDLPKDQVDKLATKVRGKTQMLMSPYEGLDKPISLQAWGFQLKVDNANDGRIDDFIKALRINAASEQGASCSQGITATGTTPHDLQGGGDSAAGGGQGQDPGQGQPPQPPQ